MSVATITAAIHRMRGRFRVLLFEEIARACPRRVLWENFVANFVENFVENPTFEPIRSTKISWLAALEIPPLRASSGCASANAPFCCPGSPEGVSFSRLC
jgi:hypothetical protein